jgi:23S rRNA pseudouridine1911/1915/1917 synthase
MDRGVSIVEASITPATDGWRLDRALAEVLPDMSRERLKALIAAGQVTLNGREWRDSAKKAATGQVFAVAIPSPTPLHNEAQDIPLVVAYEDDDLIVIDKPAGLVVHPAAGNFDGTLVNALLHHCAGNLSGIGGVARPGIVHRIDKDTSGLMIAAKTDRAHEGLAKQFHDHSIDRKKIAIVEGGKRAVTHFSTIETLRDAALIECRLETGRTHQVRVHMASIGHALLGDPVYGRTKQAQKSLLETLGFRRQALHAAHLGFIHPVKSVALAFESEMPADMQELFTQLHV